jgi:DNA modification methylase
MLRPFATLTYVTSPTFRDQGSAGPRHDLVVENVGNFSSVLAAYKAEDRRPIHSFHRYFGKLIPAIPALAVSEFSEPGEKVLDPFCGSGTTLVEARERGRSAVGIDLNPLATLVASVKTSHVDCDLLMSFVDPLLEDLDSEKCPNIEPYVVNIDHWFRVEVKIKLLKLKERISRLPTGHVQDFYLAVFSAFIRGVSNADPQHVFPGFSKRMRALEAQGRNIDVEASFFRAVKKRAKMVGELRVDGIEPTLFSQSVTDVVLDDESIDLVVTNPPYISSIRYLETMKIEMGWLDFLDSKDSYLRLDRSMIGTERFYKRDLLNLQSSDFPMVDSIAEQLWETQPKMARVIVEYFSKMDQAFDQVSRWTRTGGKLLIKISESNVRGFKVPTPDLFVEMLSRKNFQLLQRMQDDYDPSSRSLLTARNSYSGLMTSDELLLFQRV